MSSSPHKRLRTSSPSRTPTQSETMATTPSSKPSRPRNGNPKSSSQVETALQPPTSSSSSPYMPMFQAFRSELDAHHDRRERVIRASRDITAISKKMIFTLQRSTTLGSPLPAWLATDLAGKEKTIATLLQGVVPSDLTGINAWRYQRQISGGLQEYMEAAVFRHYLETGRLLGFDEAKALVARLVSGDVAGNGEIVQEGDDSATATATASASATTTTTTVVPGESTLLMYEDYILGIFDATGEMMRWGITNVALTHNTGTGTNTSTNTGTNSTNTSNTSSQSLIQDLRTLRLALEGLKTHGSGLDRDMDRKMDVMRACVEKVENAVYGLVVRGSERPKGWVPSSSGPPEMGVVEGY